MTNPKPDVTFYGLVRDKNGKPKVDGNPKDLPRAIIEMMTPTERQEIGIE